MQSAIRQMLYVFHANVFSVPQEELGRAPISLRGELLQKLTQPSGRPLTFVKPLAVTWEAAADSLTTLPQMVFEPDGSFVFSGNANGARWQVDGHLFEFRFAGAPQLHRLELHGHCPPGAFDKLLGSVGWPKSVLVFELVLEGVTLAEEDFRRWAAVELAR